MSYISPEQYEQEDDTDDYAQEEIDDLYNTFGQDENELISAIGNQEEVAQEEVTNSVYTYSIDIIILFALIFTFIFIIFLLLYVPAIYSVPISLLCCFCLAVIIMKKYERNI